MRRRRVNSAKASVTLAAHLLGYWLSPFLHAAGHRPDHVHTPGGTLPLAFGKEPSQPRPLDHSHDAEDHDHAGGQAPGEESHPGNGVPGSQQPLGHGSGSFDHFSGVLVAPTAAFAVPAPAPFWAPRGRSPVAAAEIQPRWSVSARGPPCSA